MFGPKVLINQSKSGMMVISSEDSYESKTVNEPSKSGLTLNEGSGHFGAYIDDNVNQSGVYSNHSS